MARKPIKKKKTRTKKKSKKVTVNFHPRNSRSTEAAAGVAQEGSPKSPIYEPTSDPNTWQECFWSPAKNQYLCHNIPADQVPK
jgi:hypothetical protein